MREHSLRWGRSLWIGFLALGVAIAFLTCPMKASAASGTKINSVNCKMKLNAGN